MDIITAINDLKTEKDNLKTRIAAIDKELAEIAGSLPRRRRVKAEETNPHSQAQGARRAGGGVAR